MRDELLYWHGGSPVSNKLSGDETGDGDHR